MDYEAAPRVAAPKATKRRLGLPDPPLNADIGRETGFALSYPLRTPNDYHREAAALREGSQWEDLRGKHLLSIKQVPDALAIASVGNSQLINTAEAILETGFTLVNRNTAMYGSIEYRSDQHGNYIKIDDDGIIKTLIDSTEDVPFLNPQPLHKEIGRSYRRIEGKAFDPIGLEYENVWSLLQAYSLLCGYDATINAEQCRKSRWKDFIRIHVWHGNKLRLTDHIPGKLIPGYSGKKTASLKFDQIASHEVRMQFIYKRLHWGRRLVEMATQTKDKSLMLYARAFQKKIDFFLSGKPHPSWTKSQAKSFYLDEDLRDRKTRALRFVEVLKTVNGMFNQRYLAFPNERWSWKKFDSFVIKNLNVLLDDEFLDGALRPECLGIETRYSELKKIRKTFKKYSLSNRMDYFYQEEFEKQVPKWLKTYVAMYREAGKVVGTVHKCALFSTLGQSRGMGTPPPLVVHQSKAKFLNLVSTAPVPLTETERGLVTMLVRDVIKDIPQHVFTGLHTKAAVNITTSACIEEMKREGGGTEAISKLLLELENEDRAQIFDLNSFKHLGSKARSECTLGEYIFWRCFEEVIKTSPEENREAFVAIVREPGKARTVTKGHIALRVVLDVVNKIASYPLKKVASSSSGMEKDAHGWNFFEEFFKKESLETTFDPIKIEIDGDREKFHFETTTYRTVYVECTDYNTATDSMHHEVAEIIASEWLSACGLPTMLKRIVHATCFQEREIRFEGSDIFQEIGTPARAGTTERKVVLKKGVLMGDPLTKVILHLVNIMSRKAGSFFTDQYAKKSVWTVLPHLRYEAAFNKLTFTDVPVIDTSIDTVTREDFDKGPLTSRGSFVKAKHAALIERPRVGFPLPGVLCLVVDGNTQGIGFIPEAYRDPEQLKINTWTFMDRTLPISLGTMGRNPRDEVLIKEGYIPVNPYRKKIIRTDRDKAELVADFKRSNGNKHSQLGRNKPGITNTELVELPDGGGFTSAIWSMFSKSTD
jgi:hypothetical protein